MAGPLQDLNVEEISAAACRAWPLKFPEFLLVSTFPSLPGWDWETSFPAFEETKGDCLKQPLEQE